MSVPLRELGPACPGNAAHGPLTKGADGLWHCYHAEHEGYSQVDYPGNGLGHSSPGRMPGRAPTRHAWRRDELVWPR